LFSTDLKDFPQCSKSPIVSSNLLPLLSFLPAIFQDFLGALTSFPHFGHLAIKFPFQTLTYDEDKKLSITESSVYKKHYFCLFSFKKTSRSLGKDSIRLSRTDVLSISCPKKFIVSLGFATIPKFHWTGFDYCTFSVFQLLVNLYKFLSCRSARQRTYNTITKTE